jgi:hypothetical protein
VEETHRTMIALVAAAAPAIVMQAAQQTQRTERGVVGLRVHRVFDVHAGPYHRHDDLQFAAVEENGAIVKVRILTQSTGGKETDANTKAQTANRYEHPAYGDLLERPFDPRYVKDYSYEVADARTVRFKSLVRDAAHGDGTFTLDSDDNVTTYQYAPNVYPQYTTGGTVTDQRAQVLPNYWALTQELYQYKGHYAIFGGGATATITYGNYVHFESVSSALSALDAGRI